QTIHTPYNDLRIPMITEVEEIFQRPSSECEFTASDVDEVYDHCVSDDCPEHRLFSQIKALVEGLEISKGTPDMIKFWEASDEKILEMADAVGIPLMREVGRIAGTMIQNGKIVDENAVSSLTSVCAESTGDDEEAWIEKEPEGITNEEAFEHMGVFDNLQAALSPAEESD
ncbi:hypothetical protein FRC11_009973, partial [Ceratobasidium sp. 423]